MAETPSKIGPIPVPDRRRPTRMPSLPAWAASRVDALRENLQLDPTTSTFQDMLTLPAALMLTQEQRAAIETHNEHLRSLLAQTPEASEEAEKATLVIVTKLLLVLPGQRTTEAGAEAKGDAYMAALDDLPYWATEAAVRNWYRGDCGTDERGCPYDYQWAPAPGPLRRIAQVEAYRLKGRIVMLERVLSAVEFVDCAAELAQGRTAWRGLWKTVGAKGNIGALTFEAAVKLGSEDAARHVGAEAVAANREVPDLPDPQAQRREDAAA